MAARQLRIGARQQGTGTSNANSSSCRCARCGKPAAPAVASTPAPASVTTPVSLTQARDMLTRLRGLQETSANRGLMRLLLTAFPQLATELGSAPPMPNMSERILAARQPKAPTAAPAPRTMRDLSTPSTPTAPVPVAPVQLAPCRVPSMSDRILKRK